VIKRPASPLIGQLGFEGILEQEKQDCSIETADINDNLSDISDSIRIPDLPDFKELCIIYLIEDVPYMEVKRKVFYKAWRERSLGETLMQSFIDFSKDRVNVPLKFLDMWGKQFRQVLLQQI
jgi:hypothetical protein